MSETSAGIGIYRLESILASYLVYSISADKADKL